MLFTQKANVKNRRRRKRGNIITFYLSRFTKRIILHGKYDAYIYDHSIHILYKRILYETEKEEEGGCFIYLGSKRDLFGMVYIYDTYSIHM